MDEKIHEELRRLEESLWRSETRLDDTLMDKIFSEDFCEFGRSGGIYRREEMLLGQINMTEIPATLPLRGFRVRSLSDDIVQVTYISEMRLGTEVEMSNRSSIWRRDKDGWKLCFHQGTPTNGPLV